MTKQHTAIFGMVACAMLCGMNSAFGVFSEAFEDEISAISSTPVTGLGSGAPDLLSMDDRNMMGGAGTRINIDLLSESGYRNGWGDSGTDLKLVLKKNNEWTVIDASAAGNGASPAPIWDEASWIDRVLDAGLTNSNMGFTWYPGKWGTENGVDAVYSDNIVAIPEPATYGLITIFGGGLLLFRRRFKV